MPTVNCSRFVQDSSYTATHLFTARLFLCVACWPCLRFAFVAIPGFGSSAAACLCSSIGYVSWMVSWWGCLLVPSLLLSRSLACCHELVALSRRVRTLRQLCLLRAARSAARGYPQHRSNHRRALAKPRCGSAWPLAISTAFAGTSTCLGSSNTVRLGCVHARCVGGRPFRMLSQLSDGTFTGCTRSEGCLKSVALISGFVIGDCEDANASCGRAGLSPCSPLGSHRSACLR